MPDRRTLQRITLYIVGASVLLTVATFVLGGVTMGLGAVVGGIVAVGNWLAMRFVGERLMVANDKGRLVWSVLLALKMAALLGIVALILSTGLVDPTGFTVGLSGLVFGALAGAFHGTAFDGTASEDTGSGGSTAPSEEQG
jgi:hypothetical protein